MSYEEIISREAAGRTSNNMQSITWSQVILVQFKVYAALKVIKNLSNNKYILICRALHLNDSNFAYISGWLQIIISFSLFP
jgi:hypothetical protein